MISADKIIKTLDLKPLPEEGGYYKEIYRSDELIPKNCLPNRYSKNKSYCTAIYYLLTPETVSAMHRIPSDEIFHFYLGDPVNMLHLYPDRKGKIFTLGHDINADEIPLMIVPKGTWQGCHLKKGGKFALFGVTVAPGFDFCDYENGQRDLLFNQYPDFKELILHLTPNQ